MPPTLACEFTVGELAALGCIADEVRHHGTCSAFVDAIAARSGTSRSTVQRALRQAQRLGYLTVRERRRAGQKSLTNIVTIVSREWLAWIGFQFRRTTQHKLESPVSNRTAPAFGYRRKRLGDGGVGGGAVPRTSQGGSA